MPDLLCFSCLKYHDPKAFCPQVQILREIHKPPPKEPCPDQGATKHGGGRVPTEGGIAAAVRAMGFTPGTTEYHRAYSHEKYIRSKGRGPVTS